jgi:hypothetical protein
MVMVGCTNYLSVTITVPSAGNVTLISSMHAWIDHTAGTTDIWTFMTRPTATDCGLAFTDPTSYLEEIPGAWPTDNVINKAGALTNQYAVASAGTYTYYLNGLMLSGQNAGDTIVNGSVVAIFTP